MSAVSISGRLIDLRIIPVLRFASRATAESAIDCLIEAGFETVEITLTTPDAIALIANLRKRLPSSFIVGAGTVLDLQSAQTCLDAGTDYLVSPCLVPGMAALAHAAQRACLTGGYTPAEILTAQRDGADIVKVFPAASGGPSHLAALHAVFPDIPLCPTGGVSAANMTDYFKAGAAVVGVGNNIIDAKLLAAGDTTKVISHAQSLLHLAQSKKRNDDG